MNMKKVFMKEIDDRGIVWEYVIILDKKLNCFRVFEGNKVNKDNELIAVCKSNLSENMYDLENIANEINDMLLLSK